MGPVIDLLVDRLFAGGERVERMQRLVDSYLGRTWHVGSDYLLKEADLFAIFGDVRKLFLNPDYKRPGGGASLACSGLSGLQGWKKLLDAADSLPDLDPSIQSPLESD